MTPAHRAAAAAFILLAVTGSAAAQAPGAAEVCLAAPQPACLIDLSARTRAAYRAEHPEDAEYDEPDWLTSVVAAELAAGATGAAAAHLAMIPPADLRYLLEPGSFGDLALPEGFDAEGRIARAMEDRLAEAQDDAFQVQADVAWVLDALGHGPRAAEIVRGAVDAFVAVLDAQSAEALDAAPALMETTVQVGAWEQADRLLAELTDPAVAGMAEAQGPWFQNLIDEALRVHARGETGRRLAEAPETVAPPGPDTPAAVMTDIALGWALAGDMERVTAFLRGLPEGNSFESRFGQIHFLVLALLDADRPDLGQTVALEEASDWDRNNLLLSVAMYRLDHGLDAEAEAMTGLMTDPGARAALLVWLARKRADSGRAEEARRLLRQGAAALGREPSPIRQAFVTLDIAAVQADLGDTAAGRAAVARALVLLEAGGADAGDPMMLFEAGLRAAATLALLGDTAVAVQTVEQAFGEELDALDRAYTLILTGDLLFEHGRPDLAAEFVRAGLAEAEGAEEADDATMAFVYLDAAQALLPGR